MTGAMRLRFPLPLLLALSCNSRSELPPLGQILLYVSTDAPLPPDPGDSLRPSDPMPLFDRLRIDVFGPGETAPCQGCTREFGVTRGSVDAGQASIGIVPAAPGQSGYRARVRLFRGAVLKGGNPAPDSTLDTTVALPPVGQEGITEVTVFLHTDDVGHSIGGNMPITPDGGRPKSGVVGKWAGAQRTSCTGSPSANTVCIPGGAFWMGNPLVFGLPTSVGPPNGATQRLVALSPFYLDATEVTVAAFRSATLPDKPVPHSQRPDCTYTDIADGMLDALPLNCTIWSSARAYCLAIGADLPTEAQLEYAASGLRGDLYVWGNDEPACGDAVFGRIPNEGCPTAVLPSPPGSGARDKLTLPGSAVDVVDVAGNLQEWAVDAWNVDGPPCWDTGVFHDPLCAQPTTDPMTSTDHPIKGGGYPMEAAAMRAAVRDDASQYEYRPILGFRCAKPGQ
jgi:sulfatase modifying factor 1